MNTPPCAKAAPSATSRTAPSTRNCSPNRIPTSASGVMRKCRAGRLRPHFHRRPGSYQQSGFRQLLDRRLPHRRSRFERPTHSPLLKRKPDLILLPGPVGLGRRRRWPARRRFGPSRRTCPGCRFNQGEWVGRSTVTAVWPPAVPATAESQTVHMTADENAAGGAPARRLRMRHRRQRLESGSVSSCALR